MDEQLLKRLMEVDPAQIGHYISGGFMDPEIKPISKTFKVAGPAWTVRVFANDNAIFYYALDKAPKGSVIVIDRVGDRVYAPIGEVAATAAMYAGMAGIVLDGPATDSIAIEKIGFPVFSRGLSAVTTGALGLKGDYNIPVQCGGAVVNPGDIIFGDADGVIVIPPDMLEPLLEKALKANEIEKKRLADIRSGKPVCDLSNYKRLVEFDTMTFLNDLRKLD